MSTQRYGITPKMQKLLEFLEGHIAKNGSSPSFDEMAKAIGLKSKSGIHRLIDGLEARGMIQRLPMRSRSITVCHNHASTLEHEIRIARETWWSAICRAGDPARRPNLSWEAFEAGFKAARRVA